MKYDELIKSLKICVDDLALSCNGCVHDNTTELHCKFQLMKETADAIEELQKENDNISQNFEVLRRTNEIQGKQISIYEDVLPKWISVGERLPEEAGHYLVAINGESREASAWWYKGILLWHDPVDEYEDYYSVTHWMPLPEPPKEKK